MNTNSKVMFCDVYVAVWFILELAIRQENGQNQYRCMTYI